MKSALIIIADSTTRRMLLQSLGRRGWWVDAVDSVERALRYLDQEPRNVALIDWSIGNASGLSLLLAIKLHPIWQTVPVIMMHDGGALGEIEQAFELGANALLPRFSSPQSVLRTLDRWVSINAVLPSFQQTPQT
jgi:DNA-binding response OmpR family regulator